MNETILTKREYIATQILTSVIDTLISASNIRSKLIEYSISLADELIEKLEIEPK
jgi:hypothetical protein